jgi:hypothetical protein
MKKADAGDVVKGTVAGLIVLQFHYLPGKIT